MRTKYLLLFLALFISSGANGSNRLTKEERARLTTAVAAELLDREGESVQDLLAEFGGRITDDAEPVLVGAVMSRVVWGLFNRYKRPAKSSWLVQQVTLMSSNVAINAAEQYKLKAGTDRIGFYSYLKKIDIVPIINRVKELVESYIP